MSHRHRFGNFRIAYLTENQQNVNTNGIILNRIVSIAISCYASLFARNDFVNVISVKVREIILLVPFPVKDHEFPRGDGII